MPKRVPGIVLLTGGSGRLGRELRKIDQHIVAPPRSALDVSDYHSLTAYCSPQNISILIHAAAATQNNARVTSYIRDNIIGTSNLALWSIENNVRLVYISTDYVYPSEQGWYTEESVLFPVNDYARSKLGGEMAVQLNPQSLIIRTSFYEKLDFPLACVNQYSSRLDVKSAAEQIYRLAMDHKAVGVLNLGSETRRSMYDIVKSEFNPDVRACFREEVTIHYILPPDSSMDITKVRRLMEMDRSSAKVQNACRICRSSNLFTYLNLGRTPLANSYLQPNDLIEDEYKEDLSIQVCLNCGLSQLTRVVNPDLMFKNYLYVSSTPATFRLHCEELAATTIRFTECGKDELVVDIASNDGCLLSKFSSFGVRTLGVDPAENLAQEANARGIKTLCNYWSPSVGRDIVNRFGNPKIVTATNVFAHVDDVHEFIKAVASVLKPDGIFVLEFPYLIDFLLKNEFDTAYHEHLSYLAITPLNYLVKSYGLELKSVEHFGLLHGGTVRLYCGREGIRSQDNSVARYLEEERIFGILEKGPYEEFANRVYRNKELLVAIINDLRKKGKVIWAYGASAKGNTLMNFYGLTSETIPCVVDDNPKKWALRAPGSHMRIVAKESLAVGQVDYLLLLAWNFKDEIMQRCKEVGYQGGFIIPVPEPTVIENDQLSQIT